MSRRLLSAIVVAAIAIAAFAAQSTPAHAAAVAETARINARAMLDSNRVSFGNSSAQRQLEAYGAGYEYIDPSTNRPCNINDVLLDALRKVVVEQGFAIRITSINRWCEGSDATAWWQYHIVNGGGHAFDITMVNGVRSTGATPQDVAFIRALAWVLPTPAGVGQYSCGQNFTLPSGWVRFDDTCDHVHVEYRGADVPVPAISASPVSVYRFWSPVYQGHFYTADPAERDGIIAQWSSTWTYEGPAYSAYTTQVTGTVPLYRFWSAKFNGHFYTADANERDGIIAQWSADWKYEGIAYYVYPPTWTQAGTIPVSRFWSASARHHFYTSSAAERDGVISRWSNIWAYEGDTFRVPAS